MFQTTNPANRRACGAAAAAVAALAVVACSRPAEIPAATKPVRVQPAVASAPVASDGFTGFVSARIESDLAFRVGGKVVRRFVEVGQQVHSGDPIAELDAEDYGLGLSAAVAQQQAASVDAEQAESDAQRFARLAADGAASHGDAERQRARADASKQRLDQATRQVELARNRAQYATLRAPFDGVVVALRVEAGQVVGEGQPVATVDRLGEREIVIEVPESRVLMARRSPAATATLWAVDGARFPVMLRELSPMASAATRTYRARYRIGADAPPMELGMTATVWIAAGASEGTPGVAAVTLPAAALFHSEGQPAVWIVDTARGRPQRVPVRIIRYGRDEVQVSGVRPGQLVVTAGVQTLTPQMQVVAVDVDDRRVVQAAPSSLASALPAR
jgi:RND family efflux transporter MFP subunit